VHIFKPKQANTLLHWLVKQIWTWAGNKSANDRTVQI